VAVWETRATFARMFRFETSVWLPRPRGEVFAFFADAANLEAVTPPWLNFHILTPPPIVLRAGALIDYRLRVHGVPLRWRTRIAAWEPPFRFVDEQLRGPYRRWVHEHAFEERDGGTLCRDRVDYDVLGGRLVERLFVRRDVEKIFAYRKERLVEMFGRPVAQPVLL
jgi:ligand-binding SRPBCC domain-containing protein